MGFTGFGFRVSDFRFPVWGGGLRGTGGSVGFPVLGFGFPVSGVGDSLYVRLSGGGCW